MKRRSHLAAVSASLALAAYAPAQTVVYDNFVTDLNDGVAHGGTVDVGGSNLKTLMIADDITLAPGSAGKRINSFSFTVRNFSAGSVPTRTLITIYADSGANAPGNLLSALNFATSFHPSGLQTHTFSPPPAGGNLFTVPASEKIWAGIAFDNNFGTTSATVNQMDALGQGAFGPPTLGSSADTLFITNAAGNYAVNNPVGHLENAGVSLGWRFVARDPVNVKWNLASGGTWNSIAGNWSGGSPDDTRYVDGDHATFDNPAGGTIVFAGNVAPGSTTVDIPTGTTYTFSGSGLFAGIATGNLTKKGLGRLVLANLNSSTGITTVWNNGSIGANGSGAHLTLNYPFSGGDVLSGDLHIGVDDPVNAPGVAKVSLAQADQIADNAVVYFDSPFFRFGYFSLRGNSETIAGIHSTKDGGAIENGNLHGGINTDATLTLAPPAATTYNYFGIIRDRDVDNNNGTGKLNLVVNGPGTQVLTAGSYSYTGTTTVNAGTLRLQTSLTTSSAVNVTGGTLELASGAASSRVIVTPTVAISGAGKLDLKDNKLITTTPPGTATAGDYDGVQGEVQRAFNGGAWDQPGLTTSMPDAVDGLTSIGVASGAQIRGLGPTATSIFAGQTINGASTIAMYTYAGDANLDGKINIDDYGRIDGNVGQSGSVFGWFNGDFNYDGKINIDDYGIIDGNINRQGVPFSAGGALEGAVAVPEPIGLGLLILAGWLSGRRSRSPRRRDDELPGHHSMAATALTATREVIRMASGLSAPRRYHLFVVSNCSVELDSAASRRWVNEGKHRAGRGAAGGGVGTQPPILAHASLATTFGGGRMERR